MIIIKKFLARIRAVGGTARWAAKYYHFFRRRHPDLEEFSDNSIFRLIVVSRYEVLSDTKKEKILMSAVDEFNGLKDLVVAVLTVEAGFIENTISNQNLFKQIIVEELYKKGISTKTVFGKT